MRMTEMDYVNTLNHKLKDPVSNINTTELHEITCT